ncbi:deoxyribonuclease tatD [Perkinsela sp. CCAP 1560/4]|nr:deoxyribonuclease tatD [Perkinsela sp. CCAP 1560/4]|eukprot:KNH04362.1 deoxyribonuclease tatD [Perkinsela sp. CCAP 1560/4]
MGYTKKILREGDGACPQRGQTVTVHCTGYLAQGEKKFWSTKDPGGEPFSFQVGIGQVIRGWDDGLLSMQKNESARLHLTSDVAYGAKGFPAWGIPPNAELIFDIDLLNVR